MLYLVPLRMRSTRTTATKQVRPTAVLLSTFDSEDSDFRCEIEALFAQKRERVGGRQCAEGDAQLASIADRLALQLLVGALDVGRPPTRRAKIEVEENSTITSRALLPPLLDDWRRFADA